MTIKYSGDNITFSDNSIQSTAATGFGFKNRIINGDMRIDQRNAGASVTPANGAYTYTVDRWAGYATQASKYTVQQNSGSVALPVGFVSYLGVVSSSAYSVVSGDIFVIKQSFEGYNVADFGWGSAGAQAVTLSFWVRSSLTGTFGGSVASNTANNCYPFTYTINSANTWEQKTIVISGPTTGGTAAFPINNTTAFTLFFGIGVGSSGSGTAGAWTTSGTYYSATGATSIVGTNGATFYITGVQLEKGSTATQYDYRPYQSELALCQRYCLVDTNVNSAYRWFAQGYTISSTQAQFGRQLPVIMRTTPSVTASASNTFIVDASGGAATTTAVTDAGFGTPSIVRITATVASGLTAGQGVALGSDGTTNLRTITYSAEL